MSEPQVHEIVLRDPQSVLRHCLGAEVQVVDFECEPLVKTGDNYGSTIMRVCARIRRGSSAEEELHLVAKMLPATNYQRAIFECGITFKKEIFLYQDLIPTYKALLVNGDFDVVPKFYGARLSMKPGADEVDDDAVIFMENLKNKGYYMVDRHKGLDAAHLKIALKALARFHAIGLSIKHKVPDYLATLRKYGKPMKMDDEIVTRFIRTMIEHLRQDPHAGPFADRIVSTMPGKISECYYSPLGPEHEWACVTHGDFWSNNALFRRGEAGEVEDVKIVDFQTYYLASPLTDLLFLLCTSMQAPMEGFDEALETYRRTALGMLGELGCSGELFARGSFEERLKVDAVSEIGHIVLMSKVVELREGEDLETSPLNETCLRRIRRVLDIYAEKQWF